MEIVSVIVMTENSGSDWIAVVGAMFVFALPLTLLVPGFSVWDVIPKVRVERFHLIGQELTWHQINTAVISLLVFFFSLFLEIRKRKLNDMVEKVLNVSQATDDIMQEERERQTAAVRVCVELLDASGEHYENLVLLRDDLQNRGKLKRQHPPAIDLSSCPL